MKFGIHINNAVIPELFYKLPFRAWDNEGVQWNVLQQQGQAPNISPLTNLVNKFGDVLYTLGPTPAWAATNLNHGSYWAGSNSLPKQSMIPSIIRSVVQSGITSLEPANEVVYKLLNPSTGLKEDTGYTDASYVAHQKLCWQEAKKVNPNITIVQASYLDTNLSQCLTLGLDQWVDVWNIHVYSGTGWEDWLKACITAINKLRRLVGYEKPIWITEAGCSDTKWMSYQNWQDLINQFKLLSDKQFGVERIYFYAKDNTVYGYSTSQADAILSRVNN